MNINLNGNITISNELKKVTDDALDYLWNEQWLKDSLSKNDEMVLDDINETAKKLKELSDIVVIIASGTVKKSVEAMLQCGEAEKEIIVFGDTLSSADYAELLKKLEHRNFTVVAVSAEEESIPFKAAFVCMRKLLIEKYGPSGAADRLVSVLGNQKGYMSEEISQDDIKMISIPENIVPEFCCNTAAVLLPMAIAGIDIKAYLDGFRTMIADPKWDTDGTDFALAVADNDICEKKGVISFQRETKNLAKWINEIFERTAKIKCPHTLLYLEKEPTDIMLPSFPGCSSEGSLNQLLKDQIDKKYTVTENEKNHINIDISKLDAYEFGELAAFVQMTAGITLFILNK